MLLFIVRIIITTAVVLAVSHMIPGLEVKNTFDALLFGFILGVINSVVRPILTLLTLPITLLTLGLFLLLINAFTFWLASELSYGVHIASLKAALWGGGAIWFTGLFTNRLIWENQIHR